MFKQKVYVDEVIHARLVALVKRINLIDRVITRTDKPSRRKINLNTDDMRIIGYKNIAVQDATYYCEKIESRMYVASKNVRFNNHKKQLTSIKEEATALHAMIELTKE